MTWLPEKSSLWKRSLIATSYKLGFQGGCDIPGDIFIILDVQTINNGQTILKILRKTGIDNYVYASDSSMSQNYKKYFKRIV
jgi:hypothetical protein